MSGMHKLMRDRPRYTTKVGPSCRLAKGYSKLYTLQDGLRKVVGKNMCYDGTSTQTLETNVHQWWPVPVCMAFPD
jgi:hypothetical protein